MICQQKLKRENLIKESKRETLIEESKSILLLDWTEVKTYAKKDMNIGLYEQFTQIWISMWNLLYSEVLFTATRVL